jgi:hypothetical protein
MVLVLAACAASPNGTTLQDEALSGGCVSDAGVDAAREASQDALADVSKAADSGASVDSATANDGATAVGNRYVSTTGSDANPGTSALPWRTLQHAADMVNPGDVVIVEDGTYSCASCAGIGSTLVNMTRGGTANQYVTFRSEHKWGAVLDGLGNTTAEAVEFGASYVRFQDFEATGFSDDAFSNYRGGQYIEIVGNHIHDEGRYCTSTTTGRDGIFLQHDHVTIEQNFFHDIGRYAFGEYGCTWTHAQNDHGIYIHTASDVMIRNNIFYRIEHGWGVHVYPDPVDALSVLNNTFVYASPAGANEPGSIIIGPAVTNSRIENNLFYQPLGVAIYLDPTPSSGADSLTIANNLTTTSRVVEAYDGSSVQYDPAISGLTYAHNLTSTDPKLTSTGTSTLESTTPALDAHLLSGSPAIGAGMILSDVAYDYDGVTRASPPSMGAYEQ